MYGKFGPVSSHASRFFYRGYESGYLITFGWIAMGKNGHGVCFVALQIDTI
jgi:hypothetical protein